MQNKSKNLKQSYKKVKDRRRKSGNGTEDDEEDFPYFEEMDGILGGRASTEPHALVDTTPSSGIKLKYNQLSSYPLLCWDPIPTRPVDSIIATLSPPPLYIKILYTPLCSACLIVNTFLYVHYVDYYVTFML